jgi:hypothetical protein
LQAASTISAQPYLAGGFCEMSDDLTKYTDRELAQLAQFPIGEIPPQDQWTKEFSEMMLKHQMAAFELQRRYVYER